MLPLPTGATYPDMFVQLLRSSMIQRSSKRCIIDSGTTYELRCPRAMCEWSMVWTRADLHIIIAEAMQNDITDLVMDPQILSDLRQSWELDPFRYSRASRIRFAQGGIGRVSQEVRDLICEAEELERGSLVGHDIPEETPEMTALLPTRTRSVRLDFLGLVEVPRNQTSD